MIIVLKIILFFLVIVSVFYGARIIVNLVRLYLGRKFRKSESHDLATEYVYMQVARYVIYVFSILLCFQILEIDLTLLLTGSAALLVGIGLGLQDVFKDMIAGVVLLFEGNIRIGDIVEINSIGNNGGKEGIIAKIVKINVRTTEIQTRDGNMLIIPNTKLTQEQIANWSHGSELSRFKIDISVDYGSDMDLVERLLKQAALAHPKVKNSHPVSVILSNFGESGLEIQLVFWADQSWDIAIYKSEIRFEIDRLFREHKIVIPYPKRSVIVQS
jgi:small-conductance mechanosensitive channel